MCGIFGLGYLDASSCQYSTDLLSHRGPDAGDIYVDDFVSLGHRRLSIIDLTPTGAQPMKSSFDNGRYVIVFNGEIYNHQNLRKDLQKKGVVFKGTSDTETLLEGYAHYGKSILEKLNGMFAFAIWDTQDKTLFLARDRLGIKPLYYSFDSQLGKFAFSSEIRSLCSLDWVSKDIDSKSFMQYLTFGFIVQGKSIFSSISELLPGQMMTYDLQSKTVDVERYYELKRSLKPSDHQQISLVKAKKRFLSLFRSAVSKRMLADVQVGAFLSGGVDSSSVVAMMVDSLRQEGLPSNELHTFSVHFPVDEFDESEHAFAVAKHFGTTHHTLTFEAKDFETLLPKLVDVFDNPLADYSMLPTYLVSELARKHVTVCLGGDGGDELFGGYTWQGQYLTLLKMKRLPRALLKLGVVGHGLVSSDQHLNNRLHSLLANRSIDFSDPCALAQFYAQLRSFVNTEELAKMFPDKSFDFEVLDLYEQHFSEDSLTSTTSLRSSLMNADLHEYMPSQILRKVDGCSMAHSLEVRVPFLDHELCEFVLSLDSSLLERGSKSKYLLKEVMRGILPEGIVDRKKQGFGVPLKQFFRKELKHLLVGLELKVDFLPRPIVAHFVNSHLSGTRDYAHELWAILFFVEWKKKWLL